MTNEKLKEANLFQKSIKEIDKILDHSINAFARNYALWNQSLSLEDKIKELMDTANIKANFYLKEEKRLLEEQFEEL